MCSLILAVSAGGVTLNFPFFSDHLPFFAQCLPIHYHLTIFVIAVYMCSCETATHEPSLLKRILIYFWAYLSCTRDEFTHDETW